MKISKVGVIGAGTMGAGIAGQVANAGIEVWLLDLPTDNDPNALARRGLERLRNPAQPGLIGDAAENRIHPGNTRDDFALLAECDWIAEAVIERLDIKRELYRRIDSVRRPDAIVTSNTSTIPIRLLVEGMPAAFRRRFAITHFFNPVRFMRLLELVGGEDTDPQVIDTLAAFCERELGKGVVPCQDTPGFLGNRVGVFAIQCALHAAFDLGLSPTEADAIFGRPMGIPKTGVFGLYDLIGIDLMSDVVQSLVDILPAGDPFHAEAEKIPLMAQMIADGRTGNKGGQGFYRNGEHSREVLDLASGEYRPAERLSLPLAEQAEREGLAVLLDDDSLYARFAWRVLARTLCYAASLLPEVGDDPLAIDDAMKLGYNWQQGPFEMLDAIGAERFCASLAAEGLETPPFLAEAIDSGFYRVLEGALQTRRFAGDWQSITRPPGVVRFNELRRTLKPSNRNAVASWYDLDGVALVEFHSKANALDGESMEILADALDATDSGSLRGLVLHNDAQHFSCGVNLQRIRDYYRRDDLDGLDRFLAHFQQTVHRLQTASVPVVAAPVGLSIGGGFEVVLHSPQVICHANSVTGLVESLVGVVPGGGGCKEMLYRWIEKLDCAEDISPACWKAWMQLGYGKTATSPEQARALAMLRPNDRFLNNRDRLLSEALGAIDDTAGQAKFERPPLVMPGRELFAKMVDWLEQAAADGKLLAHDITVASELARIVSGGDVDPGLLLSEQDLYDAERRAFLVLVQTAETRARIDGMLDDGAPLRN